MTACLSAHVNAVNEQLQVYKENGDTTDCFQSHGELSEHGVGARTHL